MLRFIWTHKTAKITIDAKTPQDAALSLVQIVRAHFPALMQKRWKLEVRNLNEGK